MVVLENEVTAEETQLPFIAGAQARQRPLV